MKLRHWIALVTGNMIGSGIFLLPSAMAHIGTISLWSWVISTGGALCLAAIFSQLSIHFQCQGGGPYTYVKKHMGSYWGFVTAWHYWISVWVGNAAIALACVGYLQVLLPDLAHPTYAGIASIAILWLATLINSMGVKATCSIQLVTTMLKLIPIILVTLLGWHLGHMHNLTDHLYATPQLRSHPWVSIISGTALTLWAFLGLETATVVEKREAKTPHIMLATMVGVGIAALVYVLSTTAIMSMIPATQLQTSTAPFADAAAVILGPQAHAWLALGAALSGFGCLIGWVMLQGMMAMYAAQDQLFPALFAKRNAQGVPSRGIVVTSLAASAVLGLTFEPNLVKHFQSIILLTVMTILVPYGLTVWVAIRLWFKNKQPMMGLAIVGSLVFLGLCVRGMETKSLVLGCSLTAASLLLGLLLDKKRRKSISEKLSSNVLNQAS